MSHVASPVADAHSPAHDDNEHPSAIGTPSELLPLDHEADLDALLDGPDLDPQSEDDGEDDGLHQPDVDASSLADECSFGDDEEVVVGDESHFWKVDHSKGHHRLRGKWDRILGAASLILTMPSTSQSRTFSPSFKILNLMAIVPWRCCSSGIASTMGAINMAGGVPVPRTNAIPCFSSTC